MIECKTGIYCFRNDINGKYYVGSACISFKSRYSRHILLLNSDIKNHHSEKFQRAWNKYGYDSFSFFEIEYIDKSYMTKEEFNKTILNRETYWIDTLDSFSNGYNMTRVAGSRLGLTSSKETCEKISNSHLKRFQDYRNDGIEHPLKGYTQDPKHVKNSTEAKISHHINRIAQGIEHPLKGRKGRILTSEIIEKSRITRRKNNKASPLKGKKRPVEVAEKIRDITVARNKLLLGTKQSAEHVANSQAGVKIYWDAKKLDAEQYAIWCKDRSEKNIATRAANKAKKLLLKEEV